MNTLAEQPTKETLQSFDPLASVRMFRYDLELFGYVLPETRERVRDEELSFLAEGVERAARTEFVLQRDTTNELVYRKHGKQSSYLSMLMTGKRVAGAEADKDPRKQFLADDADNDLYHGYQMSKLRPGEQHVWASPYRHDIEAKYDATFMRECGRFPDRKMGFLYRAYCNESGAVILESQTLDRSDDEAFGYCLAVAENDPAVTMDQLVAAYDLVLAENHEGERFYAGRVHAEQKENAWLQILDQKDLITYFLQKLEGLAATSLGGKDLEYMVKKHIYGVWATFKQRLDGKDRGMVQDIIPGRAMPIVYLTMLEQEVQSAFATFAAEGRVLVGCGGRIDILQGEQNILGASVDTVFSAVFGKATEKSEDNKIPNSIRCIKCREVSPKKDVVKQKSWHCPHCKYEVDICTGATLHESVRAQPKPARPLGRTTRTQQKNSLITLFVDKTEKHAA